MVVNTIVTDNESGLKAEVVKKESCGCQALAVATIPYLDYENSIEFFTNPNEGADMNKDAGFSGTPEKVHNGTDDILWTATDIIDGGGTTFNSADQNHTSGGALSIKVDNTDDNGVYQLAKGSDLDCNDYVALSMWIYVDKDWKPGDVVDIYGWDTSTNTQIGDALDLSNYFSYDSYDVWHKIVIPLTAFGTLSSSTTLDALRIRQTASEGKAPKYYLDDIQFEELGTPITYTLKAAKGTWLHVEEFTISMADEYAGTLSDGTMPCIPYDSFLGVTLISGINYTRVQNQITKFSQNILNLMEFVQLAGTEVSSYGSDGTNTWLTMRVRHIEPIVLKSENDDTLSFTIADDLSGLLHLRISAGCKVEQKNGNTNA